MANDYEREKDENVFNVSLGGRRSSISAFSADGRGNFSRTYAGPETGGLAVRQEWGADYDDALAQANAYAQMDAANRRVQSVRRHNAEVGRNSFLSALKITDQNGGRYPSQLLGGLNADLGLDGKTRAIYGMNRAQNGDLVIDFAERDANGNVRSSRQVMNRMQVYGLKNSAPGLFDDADLDGEREALLNAGYRESDIPQRVSRQAYVQSVQRGARMRQAQSDDAQMAKFVMDVARDVMKSSPNDAGSAIRQKLLMDDKFRAELMRGKPIMEEDGKTQQTDVKTGELMYEQATDEEMKQRLDKIVGLAMGGQAQGAGQDEMARKMQFVNGLLDRLYPKASQDPRMEEIRSRQMDNALEDQRAADVRRRPQQLVDYIEDGVWKRGNGYVVDGKVYDVDGREIAGAQLADRKGNPIQTQPSTQGAATQVAQGEQTSFGPELRNDGESSKWTWETYRWNPKNGRVDPKNIKGTGIAFDEKDRARLPKGLQKEFEAWMDELADPKGEWILDDGRKVTPRSALVPKDWRTNTEYNRDYDFVRAFLAAREDPELAKVMVAPLDHGEEGYWLHMNDVGKLPTHPTFSTDSYYAQDPKYATLAGRWEGETYIPGKAESSAGKPVSHTTAGRGAALLRQMRGGQPPAQGGEQSGPGGAQRAVQSEDSPIPAPNGESETTHNGKRYRWGWNGQQGRWAYNPVEPTRDEALAAEKARRIRNGEQMRNQAVQTEESEPPKLDSPSITNNSVPVSIGNSLPSRPAFNEEPMLPEERERREAERERREAELLEQNRRESIYQRFMDEHGRGPTEDELKSELARLAEIAG